MEMKQHCHYETVKLNNYSMSSRPWVQEICILHSYLSAPITSVNENCVFQTAQDRTKLLGEETNTIRATTSFQVVVESNEVSTYICAYYAYLLIYKLYTLLKLKIFFLHPNGSPCETLGCIYPTLETTALKYT